MIKNLRIYFDHDYPTAVLNKRKEYNEVKRALKEKKIRFQTPYQGFTTQLKRPQKI